MVTNSSAPFVEFKKEEIEQSISTRFERQALRFSDQIAVHSRTEKITYADLDRFSNRVAHAVRARCGDKPEPVALLFDPGVAMIAAILGVLEAGSFFIPLDPSSPVGRNAAIFASSRAACVLTDGKNRAGARNLAGDASLVVDVEDLDASAPDARPRSFATAESLACVLYTSGSSGEPKGVVHNHRNLLHSIREHTNSLKLHSDDRVSFITSYGHIAGMTSIWRALLNGARLCILNVRAEGWGELPRWMIAEGITIHQSAPTLFRQWAQALPDTHELPRLRVLHLGGEPVLIQDVALYVKLCPEECVLVHNLGSTEVPTCRQFFITKQTRFVDNVVPVGYAVEDKEVIIVDETGRQAGFGQIGEICVKSRYIALGYWQNPELTHQAFRPDPVDGDARVFATGDLGRLREDGCLEHLGRKDRQIKIRGFRVEPAETEAVLGTQSLVRQAVVAARDDGRGEKILVAYILPASDVKPSHAVLRERLRELLPAHAVPAAFVTVEAFPLTASGKVDQAALPAPRTDIRQSDARYVAPRTSVEKTIARIWEEVLGTPGVGLEDKFLDLGGNSLKAMQVITRLQNALDGVFPLEPLFNIATVAHQAAAVAEHLERAAAGDEDQFLAELEAMSEDEAENRLAALRRDGAGTQRKTSQWQLEGVSKAYLDVRVALPGANLEVEVMLKIVRAWRPRPVTVLDLGCGDGFLGRTVLEHFPGCHVWFVDFSAPMLEAAREKLAGSERATLVKADFTTSDWLSRLDGAPTFDLVVSGLSIHHQTDARKKDLYGEIHGLLASGGVFLNLEQVASATESVADLYCDYLIDHLHAFHLRSDPTKPRQEIADGFYSSPARKENILAPCETQCAWLKELGFQDVDCFFKVFEHALFGGRK